MPEWPARNATHSVAGGLNWPVRHASQRLAGVAGGQTRMYYTYVLKSQKDKKLYIGWTDNLKKRL